LGPTWARRVPRLASLLLLEPGGSPIRHRSEGEAPRQPTETVAVLTLAFVGTVLLILRLLRSNGALRHRFAELQEAKDLIGEKAALLDESQEAIFTIDLDRHIRFWNRAAEKLYGISTAEAKGRDVWELFFSKRTCAGTDARRYPDGRKVGRGADLQGRRAKDGDGGEPLAPPQRLGRQAEADLRHRCGHDGEEELRGAAPPGQRMENIGALASGVAHDLNNALTPVIVGMQLLEETDDEEERAALHQTILSSAQRGTAMVKQILGFVRGTHGEDAPVQLRHLVDEMVKIVRDTFPKTVTIESRVGRASGTSAGMRRSFTRSS